MKKGRGRTSRMRRRKLFRSSESRGVSESYKPEFIELKKWLKDRKFEDTNLVPACFPGTGRGLMTKTSLQEGQVVLSLPESCLLTTDTVIRSYLGAYVAKWKPPPSPLLALCTFLVAEKHAGDRSPWKPYLGILPKAYTCPVCLEPEVVDLLPRPLRAKAREQRARVQELFTSSRGFFSSLQPLFSEAVESVFSYSAFLWAWGTVNTRAVYLARGRRRCLSSEPDTCALAPYLDLLNHSPAVQVDAAFNMETRCYEIRAGSRWRPHEEVLICYGPHDNHRLLLEYGFVPPCNPHACVHVTRGWGSLVTEVVDVPPRLGLLTADQSPGRPTTVNAGFQGLGAVGVSSSRAEPAWGALAALLPGHPLPASVGRFAPRECELMWRFGPSPWSSCGFSRTDVLVKYLPAADKQMDRKISILKDHDFTENLTFGWDGPSWRLLTALKLLCLQAEEFPCWKKVLLGERVSDTNEKTSLDVARKICRHLVEETGAVLQKISQMKARETALAAQLTLAETLWTEELKVLRASAETLNRPHAASP